MEYMILYIFNYELARKTFTARLYTAYWFKL